MEGDALVKQLTGAQVMAMAEDVPALESDEAGRQGASDRQGAARRREVTLGGTTLVAHLTPGHTPRLHDVDVQGAGGRQELRRGDHRQRRHQPGHQAGEQSGGAADRRGIQPRLSRRSREIAAPTCRLARTPGCTTWPRNTRRSARGRTRTSTRRATRLELDIVEGVFRSQLAQQQKTAVGGPFRAARRG